MHARDERKPPVSVVGTGVMGRCIAANLLRAAHPTAVHTRTRSRAESLIAMGARWCDTVADASNAEFVITVVGMPEDVRSVYFGDGGLLSCARPGTVLIDMGTSPPALAREIDEECRERGLSSLDAPVSGGETGARDGTLSIMVGGDPAVLERARPVLEVLGTTVVHQGPSGSGQSTKLCNQIAIASNMVGICEALVFARASGLDPATVLASIGAGAAGSWGLTNLYPRMVRGDYEAGFFVRHFVKDMAIALADASRLGLSLPGLELARRLYGRLLDLGGGDLGTQALILALDDLQGSGRASSHPNVQA